MDCKTIEEKLALYLYEELSPEEHAALESHLDTCPRCAAAAEELRRLRSVLDQRPPREPSPELLVRCRWDLEEALDRESHGWRGLVQNWRGVSPLLASWRLTSAVVILLVGFSLGWTLQRQGRFLGPGGPGPSSPWIGADLSDYRINGISQVIPDPQTGGVRITLDAERQVTLEGSLEDPRIRHLLVEAMKNYDNPGIRRDTLEVLRVRADNPYVREALLYAMRNDPNPGVRLEVLEAVQEWGWSHEVEQAMLEALRHDTNPGVRVAAIQLLLEHADEDLLPELELLAKQDSNPYVRLKCATALRVRNQQWKK